MGKKIRKFLYKEKDAIIHKQMSAEKERSRLNKMIAVKVAIISKMKQEAKEKDAIISKMEQEVKEKDAIIHSLTSKLDQESAECIICMDSERDCLLAPCHHLATCQACGDLLITRGDSCPICRKNIKQVIKFYRS